MRAIFLLPLLCGAFLAGVHFRNTYGSGSILFVASGIGFTILLVAWPLAELFWSPYEDDLANVEYLSSE